MSRFLNDQKSVIAEVQKRLAVLRSHQPAESLRRDELGPLNFSEGVPVFARTFALFQRLESADLTAVPPDFLREVNQRLESVLRRIDSVKVFDPMRQSASERDNQVQNWVNEYVGDFNQVMRVITATPYKAPDFAAWESQLTERLGKIDQAEASMKRLEEETKKKADAALAAARDAAAGTGIAAHATAFADEATANRTAGRVWLGCTFGLALVTIGFGVYLAKEYAPLVAQSQGQLQAAQTPNMGYVVQLAVARLFIFSVLYFATIWCGRNFKAHKHNELVCRHRQHALRTFEAFLNAATDPGTRNAVLLQSTTAIFAPANTGFIGADSESHSQPHIIEMIKTVGGRDDK